MNCDRIRELAQKELARRAAIREAEAAASLYKPGDRLAGRWEILRVHSGGMGVVYIVDDTIKGGIEAAKTFRTTSEGSGALRDALQREAELWVRLGSHPNIVRAQHIELIGPQLYIFMEYVEPDNEDRNSLLNFLESGSMPAEKLTALASQICRGLRHAEANGMRCHRDIKPANILINTSGVAKITDFGLGKAYANLVLDPNVPMPAGMGTSLQQDLTGFTVAHRIAGTPGYIAPEIIRGEPADIRSDIFSLGLVFHQMHTGSKNAPWVARMPSDGDFLGWEQETLELRRNSRPSAFDSPMREIIDRCLAFERENRYQSFADLLSDMQELTGLPEDKTLEVIAKSADATVSELVNQANKLTVLKQWEEALDCIRRAKSIDVNDIFVWNTEGVIYNDLDRRNEALTCFERATELESSFIEAWHNKGVTLRALGRPADALVCFEKAIAVEGRHLPPWMSKANCLQDLGRFEEAAAAYDIVLNMDPNFVWALREKGTILLKLGRLEDAITILRRALEIDPSDKSSARMLNDAKQKLNEQGQ